MTDVEKLLQHDAEILRHNPERYQALRPEEDPRPPRRMQHAAVVAVCALAAAVLLALLGWQFFWQSSEGVRPDDNIADRDVSPEARAKLVAFTQLTEDTFAWVQRVATRSPEATPVVPQIRQQLHDDRRSMERILSTLKGSFSFKTPLSFPELPFPPGDSDPPTTGRSGE